MLDTRQLIALRDELRRISDRINEMRIDIEHNDYLDQLTATLGWNARAVTRLEAARWATIEAITCLEVAFNLPNEDPKCELCLERHPNDDRHPECEGSK
jgi:hypothetical protein